MTLEIILRELKAIDENLAETGKQIYERNLRFGFQHELCLLGLFLPFIISEHKSKVITLLKQHTENAEEKAYDIFIAKEIELVKNDIIKEIFKKDPNKIYEIIFTKITFIDVALALMSSKVNEIINKEYLPNKDTFLAFVEHAYAVTSQTFGISNYNNLFDDFIITNKYPKEYKEVLETTKENLTRSTEEIKEIISELKKHQKYPNEVFKGRVKSPASVFKKVYFRESKIENILDFVAIRIVTNSVNDCYSWLGIIYDLYPPRLAAFKDYILHPKPNGYKSLHITCDTKYGPVEFQIRTHTMHKFAEFGIAAHWKYKTKSNNKILERLRFALGTQDKNFGQGFIFVFTPKKDILLLPKGSCVVDFAYYIHSHLGDHLSYAEINNNIVELDTKLKDYDIVKVFTDPKKKPNRKWIEFVATNRAKDEITQSLHITHIETHTKISNPSLLLGDRIQVAQCCNPFCDDDVGIYKSTKRKLILHKTSCLDKSKLDYSLASETIKKQFLVNKHIQISFSVSPISLLEHLKSKFDMQDIILNDKEKTIIFKTKLQSKEDYDKFKEQLKEEEFIIDTELI